MKRSTRATFMAIALTALTAYAHRDAHADLGHDSVLPSHNESRARRARDWSASGGFLVSPRLSESAGSRVAAFVEVAADGVALQLEARGIDERGQASVWQPMEQTFEGDGHRVAILDLQTDAVAAQIRMRPADHDRIETFGWELLHPNFPDAGRDSRAEGAGSGSIAALPDRLTRIGVIDRATWGARASQCSGNEDDWYRMAIHHTAGGITSGGSVQNVLKATQAYTMDSGNYCDIPYQMMVGYDGSLWEGRGLTLRSGATGGGNNDGNLAVCFMGCFTGSGCPGASNQVTEEMMKRGQLFIQTLTRMENIATSADNIRGHRDWPGNSTVCPGNFLYDRLGELRADLAWFSAEEAARSFPIDGEAAMKIPVGEAVEVSIELVNTGGLAWEPGSIFLGTSAPRDSESPLYDESWPSTVRAATVSEVVEPGATGLFTFRVRAQDAGEFSQSFGLVAEGETWFGDAPWGGGPTDDSIVLRVIADGEGGSGEENTDAGLGDDTDSDTIKTSGCSTSSTSTTLSTLLLALLTLRKRRRA